MEKRNYFLLIMILISLTLAACDNLAGQIAGATVTSEPPTATADNSDAELEIVNPTATAAEPVTGLAVVDSVEMMIMESFPVKVSVRVRGTLPDGCTAVDRLDTTLNDTTFDVVITTIRPADAVCTQQVVSFEETIPLDVAGLKAGTYTVNVNGITGTFTLDVDNVAGAEPELTATDEPTPTETPAPEATEAATDALINGRVWHDLCAVAGAEEGTAGIPSAGCVAAADGSAFFANGQLEDGEPGLEGTLVNLGAGDCPASGLATAVTDADGDYVFADLAAGDYCVSIDTAAAENGSLLPGEWTFPGIGETAVTLAESEIKTDVNFGWDFEQLPVPDADLADCTNAIAFVADLNFPDDTVVAPGDEFEKGWKLRNIGTCPWTMDYSFVFTGGDQMEAETAVPLPNLVLPQEEVDIFVTFTAPPVEGTYRSDWLMSDASGTQFGVDGLNDQVIWVQIIVGIPEATPEPNSAVIGGVVWEDICFIDEEGEPSTGCVEIGETGFYRGDGSLISEPRLSGVTVLLATGACPDDGSPTANAVIATAVTDESGLYRFNDLDEGLYCVAIDGLSPENVNLLIPGNWTWPAPGTGRYGIDLGAGVQLLEIDFGWDFQE
ncbi:MAG: hypothetical protein GY796_33875 [Chloroflexi bacterium]|nr:hypothetical protein [Chloroflexota bacterium]